MSKLGDVVKEIGSGGLKAAFLRSRLMKAMRETNERRQEKRYAKANRAEIHVGNLLGGDDFCSRKVYYAHVERELGFSLHGDKTLMTFYEGDLTELRFKNMLRLADIELHEPKQTKLVGRIVGTPDAAFEFMRSNVIGEIKSMRLEQWKTLEEPTTRFLQQVGTYMGLYDPTIYTDGLVAVYGKGADDWKFFWTTWPKVKHHAGTVIRRGLQVNRAIRQGVLPPRIEGAGPKHKVCEKCSFKDICFVRDRNDPGQELEGL